MASGPESESPDRKLVEVRPHREQRSRMAQPGASSTPRGGTGEDCTIDVVVCP